jgi:UDP-glucose 4-epimerase
MEKKMKKNRKFIVTGGAGFIGSHIVERLVKDGHRVVVVDNLYSGFESYIPKSPQVTFLNVDISNWDELSRNFAYFQDADGIFHLAAIARIQPSIYDPSLTHKYNVNGTFNILEMMRMCKVGCIVYSASSSYYGKAERLPLYESDPPACETPYAITKYMGEMYCKTWGKLYGIRNACLKYFNVYGRRSPLEGQYAPVIGLFFRQALLSNPMTIVGDGEQKRDFTHVGDVVEANMLAMAKLMSPDWMDATDLTFNIGTGENYSINEVAEMVKECLAASSIQAGITNIPARIGETPATLADINRAKQVLEWEPSICLEEGMLDLKNYYLNNLKKIQDGDLSL